MEIIDDVEESGEGGESNEGEGDEGEDADFGGGFAFGLGFVEEEEEAIGK